MTGDELIPVEYDGKNYNINTRDIFNNVSDYNVSVLFPNDGYFVKIISLLIIL